MMKVLMISGDSRVLDTQSYPYRRMQGYSEHVSDLYVLAKGESRATADVYEKNLNIYNIYSDNKLVHIYNLYIKGREILSSLSDDNVVITVQDPFYHGLVGMFLSKFGGHPLEVQVHTDITKIIKKSRIKKIISKKVLNYAQGIRTVSVGAKESLVEFIPEIESKIQVLPIAVETPGFTPVAKYSINPTVLVVSRLEKEKNIEQSIKIFKQILEHIPHARLKIVGEGSRLQTLVDYVRSLGIESNVEFGGYNNDIYKEYADAQVLLHTSKFEGFGMVFVEAGICALPIVSTRVGVAPEITESIVKHGDVKAATQNILAVLSNEEEWKKQSSYTHKHAQKFIVSKDTYNQSIVSLWQRLLS